MNEDQQNLKEMAKPMMKINKKKNLFYKSELGMGVPDTQRVRG